MKTPGLLSAADQFHLLPVLSTGQGHQRDTTTDEMDTSGHPLPVAPPEILATATMDPVFKAAWEAKGSPSGATPAPIAALKNMMAAYLQSLQTKAADSLPFDVAETVVAPDTKVSVRPMSAQALSNSTPSTHGLPAACQL